MSPSPPPSHYSDWGWLLSPPAAGHPNVPGDKGITTVQVAGVESKPLTLPQAQAYIERFLANQRIGTLINQETERLRGSAKIEYIAPYAAKGN